ncbi:MAG: hypothetical protein RDV48_20350 [Candidatus Eremiobacteraeota bacterium]|nr:hypothetical protein [Candidatus Eremiobacteraeota bacterium]
MEGKRIGPISIGLEEKAVIAILGKPSSRKGYEGGTSVLVFPKEGFLVAMTPMREKPSMKATDISTTNSAYKTGKGIHVGSTAAEVTRAYGTPRVSSYEGKTSYAFLDNNNYLVITFELSGDKVSKIMVSYLEM